MAKTFKYHSANSEVKRYTHTVAVQHTYLVAPNTYSMFSDVAKPSAAVIR
jgi:hypothetical protein